MAQDDLRLQRGANCDFFIPTHFNKVKQHVFVIHINHVCRQAACFTDSSE